MKIDKDELIRGLKAFFSPGDVFEIRILEAVTSRGYPHTESGYFDYDHISSVPMALSHINDYKGAYVTVNPVNKALLSRAANRVRDPKKNPTTDDRYIERRKWFLIDCDAVRPSGISSSDDEHMTAHAKAREIMEGLSSIGWPEPIMTDSGNGAQLMYAIDLPADDNGLVKKALAEIAKASSSQVEVDLTVFNPSRIWRLPGTWNNKGDSTEERPHRLDHIVSMPEEIEFLSREQLEAIIPEDIPDTFIQEIHDDGEFDLDSWIREYCPELGESKRWNGGRKWEFPVCPFNSDHTDHSAVLFQLANGAVGFKCHHNGCVGNDWHRLRDLREPDWRNRHETEGVDISQICNVKAKADVELPFLEQIDDSNYVNIETVSELEDSSSDEREHEWRTVTSDDVENAIKGTLLGKLSDIYGMVTEPKLPVEASILKAIVTIGCCLSGEASQEELDERLGGNLGSAMLSGVDRSKLIINTGGGDFCNFYAILVGNSGSGKDIGRLIDAFAMFPNPSAKPSLDGTLPNYLIGTSGSAEGISDALMNKPNGLLLISELRNWLDEKHWMHNAMNFLTESWDKGFFNNAMSQRGNSKKREVLYCSPSAMANVQPETFERLATPALIETGNFGRWLFARMPRFYGEPANFNRIDTIERIKQITDIFQAKHGYVEVPDGYALELHRMFAGKTHPFLDSTWNRLIHQYYPRLAVELSVTDDTATQGESVVITEDAWKRAKTLTMWFVANAEKMLMNVNEDSIIVKERDKKLKEVLRVIVTLYDRCKKPVLLGAISRWGVRFDGIKTTSKERKEALQELAERGVIIPRGRGYIPGNIPMGWD